MNINELTPEQQEEIYRKVKAKKDSERAAQRDAYQGLRSGFMNGIFSRVFEVKDTVGGFYGFLVPEVEAFREVMAEYGQVSPGQRSFTITEGDLKMEVKSNKVKRFDERADMAAMRLVAFLKEWIKGQPDGTDNPMYQLAMLALGRNQKGDLDYKQVSNLYKLEGKFNHTEYTAIMDLFRESHVIEGTAIHFYFWRRDVNQVWRRIEISFNRL